MTISAVTTAVCRQTASQVKCPAKLTLQMSENASSGKTEVYREEKCAALFRNKQTPDVTCLEIGSEMNPMKQAQPNSPARLSRRGLSLQVDETRRTLPGADRNHRASPGDA